MSEKSPMKDVFTIIRVEGDGKKDYWLRIGVGFVNKDGSITVKLNAFPVNAELHVRDPRPKEEEPEPES